MRGLSLWQPWANAISRGYKTVETRNWKTEYRGDILICSAKRQGLWNLTPEQIEQVKGAML